MPELARPRRSVLYLPASNARAVEKARALSCDTVILDLEDAVAPDAKAEARRAAAAAVQAGGFGARELVVRVNGLDTPWGADDLAAIAAVGPDAILTPKISSAAGLAAVRAAAGPHPPLWAMIETCAAMFALPEIAEASARLGANVWVMGTNDLAKEMRCTPGVDRAPLLTSLSLSVMAARARGITILDGVFNDIADPDGLTRQCAQGAAWGFDGKTLIHPGQIDAANGAFTPEAGAVAWARTVVAAFDDPETRDKGVLKVEGRMVERLHLEEARRLITVADAIARRDAG
jgi:citrate lyase subunit beta / citryl-CoA lyase